MVDAKVQALVATAAKIYDCEPGHVLVKGREEPRLSARHAVWWVMRTEWGLSFPAIARRFGWKDHTTILSGVDRMSAMVFDGAEEGLLALELAKHAAVTPPVKPGIRSSPGVGVMLDEADFHPLLELG